MGFRWLPLQGGTTRGRDLDGGRAGHLAASPGNGGPIRVRRGPRALYGSAASDAAGRLPGFLGLWSDDRECRAAALLFRAGHRWQRHAGRIGADRPGGRRCAEHAGAGRARRRRAHGGHRYLHALARTGAHFGSALRGRTAAVLGRLQAGCQGTCSWFRADVLSQAFLRCLRASPYRLPAACWRGNSLFCRPQGGVFEALLLLVRHPISGRDAGCSRPAPRRHQEWIPA
jgi:hypothetical protein